MTQFWPMREQAETLGVSGKKSLLSSKGVTGREVPLPLLDIVLSMHDAQDCCRHLAARLKMTPAPRTANPWAERGLEPGSWWCDEC